MKFYSYCDVKTQFSQIFLDCIITFWVGGGGGGGGGGGWGEDKSPSLSPVNKKLMANLCCSV